MKTLAILLMSGCALVLCGAASADSPWDRGVPPGHLPPPGECRVWLDGVPPGQQAPPTDCRTAHIEAYHYGGRVIGGAEPRWAGDRGYACDERDYWKGECGGGRARWDDRGRWRDDAPAREPDWRDGLLGGPGS